MITIQPTSLKVFNTVSTASSRLTPPAANPEQEASQAVEDVSTFKLKQEAATPDGPVPPESAAKRIKDRIAKRQSNLLSLVNL